MLNKSSRNCRSRGININGVPRKTRPYDTSGRRRISEIFVPVAYATPGRRDALTVDVRLQKVNKPWNIARSRRTRARRRDEGWPYYPSRELSAPCGIKSTVYLVETLALDTSKGTKTTTAVAAAFDYIPSVPSKRDPTRSRA